MILFIPAFFTNISGKIKLSSCLLDFLSYMAGYSLMTFIKSHCFEEYPRHCHNLGRHFHYLYSPLIHQNVSRAQKSSPNDRKQSQTVYNCISVSFFPRFSVVNCRKQDEKTEIFLSLLSCLRSLAIIGDWSGMNIRGVSIYANCLRSSHRKLFVIVCDGVTRIWKLGF